MLCIRNQSNLCAPPRLQAELPPVRFVPPAGVGDGPPFPPLSLPAPPFKLRDCRGRASVPNRLSNDVDGTIMISTARNSGQLSVYTIVIDRVTNAGSYSPRERSANRWTSKV